MAEQVINRKLAAILSADVKGYSLLMSDDEIATVRTITVYRKVMNSVIQRRRGRIVDSPGDNLLAEFGSAVDAVQCAVEIQTELEKRNSQLPDDRKMVFRIGINIGDVIVEGEEIYGDGVNIAARLEGLSDPGGICISGAAYDQVKGKLPLGYDFMGLKEVKNISEPVRAYRAIWGDRVVESAKVRSGRSHRPQPVKKGRQLLVNILITSLLMIVLMPFVNSFKLNLLTKMWQCRLTLLPNSGKVVVVTIDRDENRKMKPPRGMNTPPPFMADPKVWRRYHSRVIKELCEMGVGVVGFDFWFPPPQDNSAKKATGQFVQGLKWAKERRFPVVLGQAQNPQDPAIYGEAGWGFISVYKDVTLTNRVKYLLAWDRMDVSGLKVEKPSFFVQVLAEKLRLNPIIEGIGVRLIGKPIPRRLWLAFSETPFETVPYHEIYNGWAKKELFAEKIVLIGLSFENTDYFKTPYSPTDFTPRNSSDSYGMPGVFLFAHAINQIIDGYYHVEINDEWSWVAEDRRYSLFHLESILFLLVETLFTCLLIYVIRALTVKRESAGLTLLVIGITITLLIIVLILVPVLFGLANFLFAAIIFTLLSMRRGDTKKRIVGKLQERKG